MLNRNRLNTWEVGEAVGQGQLLNEKVKITFHHNLYVS
jgi:hypothetical protein